MNFAAPHREIDAIQSFDAGKPFAQAAHFQKSVCFVLHKLDNSQNQECRVTELKDESTL